MKTLKSLVGGMAKEIGQAVKAEREKLKLTQLELANFAECGITFVNQLEQGKATVRLDKLLRVINALGMSMVIAKGNHSIEIKGE